MENIPSRSTLRGNWVQTERAAHEAWAALIAKNANAARIMHVLVSKVGDQNAVVISQKALATMTGITDRTVRNALRLLADDNWLEIRQIGQSGTVNAYVLNDRVVWSGKRDGIRYSLFSAAVVLSDEEQPDRDFLGQKPALRRLPSLFRGEQQLPSGEGLPPTSQPSFPGMEPDLPATDRDETR